jgi:voltage-gated potassium channel
MNARAREVETRFEPLVLAAALLVVPVIVIEESSLGHGYRVAAAVANWLIWIVFASEFAATTFTADRRWAWVRGHIFELVIVVATLPFYPASLQSARLLRLARVLRLLRLARLGNRVFTEDGVRYAALAAALTILGGGAAYASVEHLNTWDGVWWAINTMTTLGGGQKPTSDMGRVITIVVLAVGIGFVAFFTGAIAERFVRRDVRVLEAGVDHVDTVELQIASEIREITQRLQRLELQLAQLGRHSGGSG